MVTAKKTGLFLAMMLLLMAIWPAQNAFAAQITRFYILDAGSTLIAGKEYYPVIESDKAFTTSVEYVKYEYSADNGATWIDLPITVTTGALWYKYFVLPIDPGLVSVKIRASAYFSPLIGSKTYSEKIIGPYKVLQPGDPTDLVAVPNKDGSVTLTWNDRSNMESYYQITRSGPDGTKVFTIKDTMERIGPLRYLDTQTNPNKSTIYHYSVAPIIENNDLPEYLRPGTLNVIAITTVPLKPSALLGVDLTAPISTIGADYNFLKSYANNVSDLIQIAVSGVKMNTTAMSLRVGATGTLTAKISPTNAANQKVTWSSDNKEVADVDNNGRVAGKSPGTARITVKTDNGQFTAVCVVTVSGFSDMELVQPNLGADIRIIDPTIVRVHPDEQSELDLGKLQQLILQRETALNLAKKLQLEQENGAKQISGNTGGGPDKIAVSFVYISDEDVTLVTGTSRKLTAIVAPVDATNQNVTWSSDNPQVADVDRTGNITAKSPGKATITVTTQDGGYTNACVVTVVSGLTDIDGHQANAELSLARAQGIVNGYPDQSFKPDGTITRAEFTVMLMNGLKPESDGGDLHFTDKNSIGTWAVQQVAQAVDLGIISGYDDGTFRPNANITRAEMITMVMRAYGMGTNEAKQTGYADDGEIPNWARAAANTAEETGIIIVGGKPIEKFAPQALSTRAEAASSIVRMLMLKKM
ncbi:Ig-like domain-containing protein [Paenibacillus mesophilus]|uniref:Ig-like domain-containing protein n=1 Tax=Paenibacillus mesophilus TaxID=2582849 RepID=UPI0013052A11|nr:Ig-like domain-containing protein [Paenibacillus mesophilus]